MNNSPTAGTDPAAAGPPAAPDGGRLPGDAPARARYVEDLLGDPFAADNPHGHRRLLAADERRQAPAATEELLARFGLAAEFVPTTWAAASPASKGSPRCCGRCSAGTWHSASAPG